jgi:hypothetical protein
MAEAALRFLAPRAARQWIEGPGRLDERRAEVGLPPMAERLPPAR